MAIKPIDLRALDTKTANVYEAIVVASKRARQVNDEIKTEFNSYLNSIPSKGLDDESEDIDNPDQLKVSLEFEKREKPHIQSLDELLDGKVPYRYKNKD
jgi:DNA-directed RNA polymerase subunit K/omega